jgi:acetyl-CoA acetyltransferase
MQDVYVVSAVRTAVGKANKGSLDPVPAGGDGGGRRDRGR